MAGQTHVHEDASAPQRVPAHGEVAHAESHAPSREFGSGFGLGRWFGIEIQVDWSLLIVFALVMFNLGGGVLPAWHPDWSGALTWTVAFAAAVSFFGSVLAHELAHALVARHHAIPINRITLFLFGGLAHMQGEPPSPKSEFWMAVVGPIASALIGLVAILAGMQLSGDALARVGESPDLRTLQAAMTQVGPVATVLLWLGPINFLLAAFNIVPGFPLDGGRVLRSVFWWTTGDLLKATRWASNIGQVFAWALMAIGVLNMLGGGLFQGLWLTLIGWFLNNAARVGYQQLLTRQALGDVTVRRVMWSPPQRVPPTLPVDRFVHDFLMATDQVAFPVEDEHGELVGLAAFEDVRKVPAAQWERTRVADIMTPIRELPSVSIDAAAGDALEELVRRDVDQLPVLEGTHLQGMVRRRDLLRWIAIQGHRSQL